MPPELLRKWVGSAEILIAADGGADSILAAGFKPDAIVGDLDSLSEAARLCGCELHKITDQNYTDCDKLLRYVQDRELLPITLAGIEGDRIDHVLGSLYSVAASGIHDRISLAFRRSLGWIVGPGIHLRPCEPGRVVSLIPLITCANVRTGGLKWPLTGQTLEAGGLTSVSNQATASEISIGLDRGSLLLTVEHDSEEFPIW